VAERIAEIVILAEDLNQSNFVRHFLKRKGHHARRIRAVTVPQGKGSGEQHVRTSYPTEVQYYRNRASHRTAALVASVDADVLSVTDRMAELESALKNAGEIARNADEAIALFIPKRNIETWIQCLLGARVNEIEDYKSIGDVQDKIKPAARTFFDWCRPKFSVPAHCVESLQLGLLEANRVE
jgi:hypothetical protein